MPFTAKDLETILEIALGKAHQFGVEPNAFESIYRASVAEVVERKANDVSELYASLQVDALYCESYQMGKKRRGNHSETNMSMADVEQIRSKVNTKFGTNLTDSNRGNNQVYVWLERDAAGKGVLHSYGNAHADGVDRFNSHYFVVVADFDKLSRVIESFVDNPNNITTFTNVTLGWKNEKRSYFSAEPREPNLYTLMTEMHVHSPNIGQKKVEVK